MAQIDGWFVEGRERLGSSGQLRAEGGALAFETRHWDNCRLEGRAGAFCCEPPGGVGWAPWAMAQGGRGGPEASARRLACPCPPSEDLNPPSEPSEVSSPPTKVPLKSSKVL